VYVEIVYGGGTKLRLCCRIKSYQQNIPYENSYFTYYYDGSVGEIPKMKLGNIIVASFNYRRQTFASLIPPIAYCTVQHKTVVAIKLVTLKGVFKHF